MCFSWSLQGPNPPQPTVGWPRRDTPTVNCASGAKQHHSVTIQFVDRSTAACLRAERLEFKYHAIFRFQNPMFRFWAKINLRHRILKSKKIRSDFSHSDCVRCFNFWVRKIQICSSISDRVTSNFQHARMSFCPGYVGNWYFSPPNVSDLSPRSIWGYFSLLQAHRYRKLSSALFRSSRVKHDRNARSDRKNVSSTRSAMAIMFTSFGPKKCRR